MQAWLLRVFVAPHISLIMVVNVGSMRWALLLFKYFRSMPGLSHSYGRWPESKKLFVASVLSTSFACALSWIYTRDFSHGEPRGSLVYLTTPCAMLRCIAKSCESRLVRLPEERKLRAEMCCRMKASSLLSSPLQVPDI